MTPFITLLLLSGFVRKCSHKRLVYSVRVVNVEERQLFLPFGGKERLKNDMKHNDVSDGCKAMAGPY